MKYKQLCQLIKNLGSTTNSIYTLDIIKTSIDVNPNYVHMTDIKGRTLLHYSCKYVNNDSIYIISLLIKNMVDILAQDIYGNTPLMILCKNKDSTMDIIRLILNSRSTYSMKPILAIKNYNNERSIDLAEKYSDNKMLIQFLKLNM